MERNITITQLQQYVKSKDFDFDKHNWILKFMEESGELANAILHDYPHAEGVTYKNTLEEEFGDVLFCLCALANLYDVDIEKWFIIKQKEIDKEYNANYFNEFFQNKI